MLERRDFLAKQFPRKQRIYNKIGIPIPKYFSQNGENFAIKKKKKNPNMKM
jgi:hypothetical protein